MLLIKSLKFLCYIESIQRSMAIKKSPFRSQRGSEQKNNSKDFADTYPVPDWLINVTDSHPECQNSPY